MAKSRVDKLAKSIDAPTKATTFGVSLPAETRQGYTDLAEKWKLPLHAVLQWGLIRMLELMQSGKEKPHVEIEPRGRITR